MFATPPILLSPLGGVKKITDKVHGFAICPFHQTQNARLSQHTGCYYHPSQAMTEKREGETPELYAPTPETDRAEIRFSLSAGEGQTGIPIDGRWVHSNLARSLERRLNGAIAERDGLHKVSEKLKEDLELRAEIEAGFRGEPAEVNASDGIWTAFCDAIESTKRKCT